MTAPTTVAGRVAAGAAYLDRTEPDWWQRIDLDRLNLRSTCQCILGQLHDDYFVGIEVHREVAIRPDQYGFEADELAEHEWISAEYDELDTAWRDLITTRRAGTRDAGRITTAGAVILIAIACIIALAATGNWGP